MSLHPAINHSDHIKGNLNASLEIVEYGDFECAHCGAAHSIMETIMKEFSNQIKFVFRNFPLSEMHTNALEAAKATEAAALQGKYWEMHNSIFENQDYLQPKDLIQRAENLGLDIQKFKVDMRKNSIAQKIETDFESGIRSGVNGTPSFFINGNKFDGDASNLLALIQESVA
ncbi:thioredoxin domain-containing protein [Cellulophaga sp. E16_2]|uniref:DsbA family protein n=1 Tax=unclassified Cellulophaga TaxID=2634405 RepID=UPI0013FD4EB7|nr:MULTISPECIES: thioredoxin domain-containing protein [unclassified Cellulophaga]MBO0592625.1 thioredoxin domain-containing protein [Cellulophaga sp. E16_2]